MNSSCSTPVGYKVCPGVDHLFAKNLHQISPSGQVFLIFLIAVNILIFPFTAVLNSLVMISVKVKSRLRDHKSNVLLALLALLDLSVGILAQPSFTIVSIIFLLDPPTAYSAWRLLRPVMNFLVIASLLHMVLLSGEPYLAVKHPFTYITLVTAGRLSDCLCSPMAPVHRSASYFSPWRNCHWTHKFNNHYFIYWLNCSLPCNSLHWNSQTRKTTGIATSYSRGKAASWERQEGF